MLSKGSFEDYLYILIGIIWVAFSFYKGSKNKKHAVTSVSKKKAGKGLLETLFDEFTQEEQPQEDIPYKTDDLVADIPAPSVIPSVEQKVFSYDDIYEEGNYSEAENTETTTPSQVDLEKRTASSNEQIRRRRFNFKKAIIYSEILQPKYF
jgi:hypothetical protein